MPDKTMTSIFTSLWHAKSHTSRYLAQNKVIKFIMSIVLAMSNSTQYSIALCLVFSSFTSQSASACDHIRTIDKIYLSIYKEMINLQSLLMANQARTQLTIPRTEQSKITRCSTKTMPFIYRSKIVDFVVVRLRLCVCVFVNIN